MGAHDRNNDRLERAHYAGLIIPSHMLDDDGVVLPEHREAAAAIRKRWARERDEELLVTLALTRRG